MRTIIIILLFAIPFHLYANNSAGDSIAASNSDFEASGLSHIKVKGYIQTRYNGLLQTNPNLGCEQCDKSWGGNSGFFIRRIRLSAYGQITKNIYVYVQPDLASAINSTSLYNVQLRDAFFDLGIDKNNEFRFRIGQSKLPYGFENMQSSQVRLPLDRSDAINSAIYNERDVGVLFYWAPKKIRNLFSDLVQQNYKGSGDYGVFGIGIYNGQIANRPELNKNKHVVARLSYPIQIGSQIIEPGIQAYTGKFVINPSQISAGVKGSANYSYLDERAAASFILYPKPFGIMAEYNIGKGPEYDKASNSILLKELQGGYATLNYRIAYKNQFIFPFARYQYYKGGKKQEQDARSYLVKEFESGIEWQPSKHLELVVEYTISQRRYEDALLPNNAQKGNLLRIQVQVSF